MGIASDLLWRPLTKTVTVELLPDACCLSMAGPTIHFVVQHIMFSSSDFL